MQLFLVLLALAMFWFGYYPTLVADYVPEDQWRAFRYSVPPNDAAFRWHACSHMVFSFYVYTGRPLVWLGECAEHAWVASIHDFRILRPFVLILALATVLGLGAVLARWMGSFAGGVIVAAIMLFSPGYAFMYFQGLTGAPVLAAVSLAILSFHCVNRSIDAGEEWTVRRPRVWITAAAALFLASLAIYPAFSFIVLTLIVLQVCFDEDQGIAAHVWRLAFFAACALAYFVAIKIMVLAVAFVFGAWAALADINNSPRAFTLHISIAAIVQKLATLPPFFDQYMPIMNFLRPAQPLKVAILILGVLALVLHGRRSGLRGLALVLRTVVLAGVLVVLAVGSLVPWGLAAPGGPPPLRYTLPWQFLSTALLAKFLVEVVELLADHKLCHRQMGGVALFFLLLVPATLQENKTAITEVMLSKGEITNFRTAVRDLLTTGRLSNLQQIHLVRPPVPGSPDAADINPMTTAANPVAILWMFTAAFRDLLPAEQLRTLKIVDCAFDTACVEQAAGGGSLVLSQSLPGEKPVLLPRSFVLDDTFLERDIGRK